MPNLWEMIGATGHGLAAVLFTVLAILTSRRAQEQRFAGQVLIVALTISALWSLQQTLVAVLGAGGVGGAIAETLRNFSWLLYLWVAIRHVPRLSGKWGLRALVFTLSSLLSVQLLLDIAVGEGADVNPLTIPVFQLAWFFRCMFALGALALLHALFSRPAQDEQSGVNGWVAAALTFMWAYDCNHYGLALLNGGDLAAIGLMRGFAMALLAPVIAIGLQVDGMRSLRVSRGVMHRGAGLLIGAVYLLAVVLLASSARAEDSDVVRVIPIALLFALSVGALAILPSSSLRSWLKVEISKHFFAHRYDYRVEWRRFTEAVSEGNGDNGTLGERIARGVAQITGSAGAITFLANGRGELEPDCGWQWPDIAPLGNIPADICREMTVRGWIIDFDATDDQLARRLPLVIRANPRNWALVPAIHNERLVGAVLLMRPSPVRKLDWEDLDMMRVVGGQAAATISEALSHEALQEVQRFDEFNRRFAFILHDIKNQVSQMSLLARNAERHAENPAFRADMVITLRETATRMTEMLQKLAKPEAPESGAGGPVALGPMLGGWAPAWRVEGELVHFQDKADGDVFIHVDDQTLHRALGQLVHNAIEANEAGEATEPVLIRLRREGGHACIDIVDQGRGMSAEFLRSSLFRPFASTKATGFGLGAREARHLIEAMGGSLHVMSALDRGTTFTVRFPLINLSGDSADSRKSA